MTADQLVLVILGVFGVLLQLALKYAPKVSVWYQSHPGKGLVALLASVIIGAVYFALSCTPYAVDLKIALSCDKSGIFTFLQAVYIIATTQQVTYLITKDGTKG